METTRVFFSFHFHQDRNRTRTVMEHWLAGDGTSATPFLTRRQLMEMIESGIPSIYAWVEAEIARCDASVVLIGANSSGRHFMEYEIAQSVRQHKPVIGVHIHGIPDASDQASHMGENPLFPMFPIYDWVEDDGPANLHAWVQAAIEDQGDGPASFEPFFRQGLIQLPEGLEAG